MLVFNVAFASKCKICKLDKTIEFLNLGDQPNGNKLLSSPLEYSAPTRLAYKYCSNCLSIQQTSTFSDAEMYEDHPYLTLHNTQYLQDLDYFTKIVIENCELIAGDLVIDIGCNDGSLLEKFKSCGFSVFGVDPSDTAFRYSKSKNIQVHKDFWNYDVSNWLKVNRILPKVVVSTASFYHMTEIQPWMEGISNILSDGSYFAVQFVYSLDIIRKGRIDQFYHEHTFLHSITAIKNLASLYGFNIIFVQETASQGGSCIVIMKKNASASSTFIGLEKIIESEFEELTPMRLQQFAESVDKLRFEWDFLANEFLRSGEKIVGIGASLRGISLINFLKIDPRIFSGITEINSEKIGYWTPGSVIPIHRESLAISSNTYYMVLAWTQKEEILKKYQESLKSGNCLVFPSPYIEFYGNDHLGLEGKLKNWHQLEGRYN